MTAVSLARTPAAPPVPVTVNGKVIARAAITREVQYHPAASPGASWRKAAEALVLRELLLQEAHARSILAVPELDEQGRREIEEEALVRALIEQEVKTPEPSGAELRRYYAANRRKFRSPELVEASHILISAPASDEAAFAAALRKAERLAEELAAAPWTFADQARAHSNCSSSGEGGFLGQLGPGETTPEFAEALAGLAEGEMTPAPVRTRYGLHVIRLDRRIPAEELPFEAVSERIAAYLAEKVRRTAIAQFIALLVSRATITGVEIASAEAHRVG